MPPGKAKMTSNYRPTFKPGGGWRERMLEKERQEKVRAEERAEQERLKKLEKNETNFPGLNGSAAAVPHNPQVGGRAFAALAKDWKVSDEKQQLRERLRAQQTERERMMDSGVFVYRPRRMSLDIPEEDEEAEPEYREPKVDHEGWEEVKRKARKGPRMMTDAELEAMYSRPLDDGSDNSDSDANMNGELFEKRRHRDDLY